MSTDADATLQLKRKARPKPLFAGIRPYPWLEVHPAGHPHEGHPIERTTSCCHVTRDGEVCEREYDQQKIDMAWVRAGGHGRLHAFMRHFTPDDDGSMWTPTMCPKHEREALEESAAARDRSLGVGQPSMPQAWWTNLQRDEPPAQDELFGGLA